LPEKRLVRVSISTTKDVGHSFATQLFSQSSALELLNHLLQERDQLIKTTVLESSGKEVLIYHERLWPVVRVRQCCDNPPPEEGHHAFWYRFTPEIQSVPGLGFSILPSVASMYVEANPRLRPASLRAVATRKRRGTAKAS